MKRNWKRIIADAASTLGTAAGAMGAVPGTAGIAAAGCHGSARAEALDVPADALTTGRWVGR